jgi:hypothetical protein
VIREITPVIRVITPQFTLKQAVVEWLKGPFLYSISLITSATMVGLLFGILGTYVREGMNLNLNDTTWTLILAFFAIAYAIHEMNIFRIPAFNTRWQVPAQWSRKGKHTQASLYGFVLGADVFTLVPYATLYLILLLEFSSGGLGGMILGLLYGLTRALIAMPAFAYSAYKNDRNTLPSQIIELRFLFNKLNGLALLTVGGIFTLAALMHIIVT